MIMNKQQKVISKKRALALIAQEIERCGICRHGKTGKPVAGEGNPQARIVFIGEAPGKEEAKTGRPFVGPSGKFLRELMKGIGLSEEKIYITSPVKYLPKYKTPRKSDVSHGRIHLKKQLEIINPKIIVLLGGVACQALLDKPVSITEEHGSIIERDGKKYFITFHPASARRFPKFRQAFLSDFKKIKTLIKKK